MNNAEKVINQGVEFESLLLLSERLTLNLAVSYVDAHYDEYTRGTCAFGIAPGANGFCNLSGDTLPFAPKWKANAGIQYEQPLAAGDLYSRLDLAYFESVDTTCINDNELPWVPFTPYSDQVHIKLLRVDPVRGETVTLLRAPVDMVLPKHHHSGTVSLYTIAGAWRYQEHDWVAKPGSVVLETAASSHTPMGVPGYGDEIITFQITVGDLLYLDENDQVCAIENWKTAMKRYLAFCEANGIAPQDLSHA